MENFFIDKFGSEAGVDGNDEGNNSVEISSGEDDESLGIQEIDLFDELPDKYKPKEKKQPKKNEFDLNNTYLITSYKNLSQDAKDIYSNVDKILKKSSIKPGLEKEIRVPPEKSRKLLKLERKKLREKTKGKEWFDIPATEVTDEIMTDFKLLKMRSVLDRKHVYKKNDITSVPKYFQVGKVIDSPADFYGGRIPKSQRKKTFVDELLADAEFKRYQKKKYKEIMDENRRKKRTKKNLVENKKHKSKQKSKTKKINKY